MNKSEFTRFLAGACPEARIALDSHDTAQREALARVEAERDDWKSQASGLEKVAKDNAETANTAQAQLAEALTLIRDAKEGLRTGPSYGWEDRLAAQLGDFLARLAQAEQQEAQGAQAGEFQREDRYIVIKRKDLEKMTTPMAHSLGGLLKHLPKREYLVVESDWPEYEPTWAAIQARMTGQVAQAGDERVAFEQATRKAAREFGDEANDEGFTRDDSGEFAHRETMQLHRICQLYRAALATQPAAGEPIAYVSAATIAKLKLGKSAPATLFAPTIPEEHHGVALYAAQPVAGEPIQVETVAITREDEDGLYLDWVLEGGISALEAPGVVLLVAHGEVTDRHGSGEVYLAPPAAAHGDEAVRALAGMTDLYSTAQDELDAVRRDAERYRWLRDPAYTRWGTMFKLYRAGAELDEAIDAAMRAQAGEGESS